MALIDKDQAKSEIKRIMSRAMDEKGQDICEYVLAFLDTLKETPTWVNRAEQRQKDQADGKKMAIMEIRTEIERRIAECEWADGRIRPPRTRHAICSDELTDLLYFLDTLEAEEKTPKIYEATCVDFDDDGTPIFYGDSKVPDLELDDKITFRVWWKKKK